MLLNVEPYCLLGSALDIVWPGWGFTGLCMTGMVGGQGTFMLLALTAIGRALSGCVLAVAYADIFGVPHGDDPRHAFN